MSLMIDRMISLEDYLSDGFRITIHKAGSGTGSDFICAASLDGDIVGTFVAPNLGDTLDGIFSVINDYGSVGKTTRTMHWPSDFPGKH